MTRECDFVVRSLEEVGSSPFASLGLIGMRGWEDCVGNTSTSEDTEGLDVEWTEVAEACVEVGVEDTVVVNVSCSAGAAHTSLYNAQSQHKPSNFAGTIPGIMMLHSRNEGAVDSLDPYNKRENAAKPPT